MLTLKATAGQREDRASSSSEKTNAGQCVPLCARYDSDTVCLSYIEKLGTLLIPKNDANILGEKTSNERFYWTW